MGRHLLDLRGEVCPMNFVRTKLRLEELQCGEWLEVWLDDGEPVRNVPRSVRDEGHRILQLERADGFYKLLIEKA